MEGPAHKIGTGESSHFLVYRHRRDNRIHCREGSEQIKSHDREEDRLRDFECLDRADLT